MNIFEKIKELNWPKNSYVIVGGGVLVALGLIEWDEDVDISVTDDMFSRLKNEGWPQEKFQDKFVLKHKIYDVGVGFGEWDLEQLLEDAIWIEGIPFISLVKLKKWKVNMNRPKDLAHVKVIEQYLRSSAK